MKNIDERKSILDLKNQHNQLLENLYHKDGSPNLTNAFARDIRAHLKDLELAGETTYANSERAMLLADIRFWSSVLFDIKKRYTEFRLRPISRDHNLADRLKSIQQSLQNGCTLQSAAEEIEDLSYSIEALSSDEPVRNQLTEARKLLKSKQQEQSTLLGWIRQGDTEEVLHAGTELERLLIQKVTEIYDGAGQPAVPTEQALMGVRLRLQILNDQAIVRSGWTQILALLSDPTPAVEQWWNELQKIEIPPTSNSEGALFLGPGLEVEIQRLSKNITLQQDLYKHTQKIAQEPSHTQKASLLQDMIIRVEHSSEIISSQDFCTQLREIGIKEARIVLEQARQKFNEKNYQKAREYGDLILYFAPEDKETIGLLRNIDQAVRQQKELENEHRRWEADLLAAIHPLRNLTLLNELIEKVTSLENQQLISPQGLETLQQARLAYQTGFKRHRELTLKIYNGSLQERFEALSAIRALIAEGETQIWDTSADGWRPAGEVLSDADRKYQQISSAEIDALLQQAGDLLKTHPDRALQLLSAAQNKNIAYTEADRRRLVAYSDKVALKQKEQENERRRLEENLFQVTYPPRNLSALHELIIKAETLETQQALSSQGQNTLQAARQAYEKGLKEHAEITFKIHSGDLQGCFEAMTAIRAMINQGETQIWDALDKKWRPVHGVLMDAENHHQRASIALVDDFLQKAKECFKTRPARALQILYVALNKNTAYTEADRRRLESCYLVLYRSHGQRLASDQSDQDGYMLVQQTYEQRLKRSFNSGAEWLNQFFRSSIGSNTDGLLAQARAEDTDKNKASELIRMATSLARTRMEGSIEIPEVMVRGSVILFNKGLPEYARDLLAEARSLYTLDRTDKMHRHAVTSWLKGCLEYMLGRRLTGYTDWKQTHSLFTELAGEARRERHTEQADWYKGRVRDIEIWASQTFEEVYFQWMNQFEPMFLPGALHEYRKIMDTQFGNKKYRELDKTIRILLRESKLATKPEVAWCALVEAAFFEYQMHNTAAALKHLKEARDGFQFTHRGAVTLWLLGMIRWWLPSQRNDAILNWEESIALFQTLSKQADQANKQDQRRWYEAQVGLMNISLKQWIQLTK